MIFYLILFYTGEFIIKTSIFFIFVFRANFDILNLVDVQKYLL